MFYLYWFDNVVVAKLSDQLCDLKFQSKFFPVGFRPTVFNLLPYDMLGDTQPGNPVFARLFGKDQLDGPKENTLDVYTANLKKNFILLWNDAPSLFTLRYRRVIESILFHHPDAHVGVYSNTLPEYFFHKFHSAGYDVQVIRYEIEKLAAGGPGERWVSQLDGWADRSTHLNSHLDDFLKLLLLYREGGVYIDSDIILLKQIQYENLLNGEPCRESEMQCIEQKESGKIIHMKYYFPIGILAFKKKHPILRETLTYFDTIYDPSLQNCGPTYLSFAFTKVTESRHASEQFEVLPKNAFYPISQQKIVNYFEQDDQELREQITATSCTIKFWGKFTGGYQPSEKSLMGKLFNEYSLSNLVNKKGLHF